MADRPVQNLQNHAMFDPPFHYFLVPVLALGLGKAVWDLIKAVNLDTIFGLIWTLAIVVLAFKARIYALKVQDRLIRLEEQLRMQRVLPPAMHAKIGQLNEDQFVGLRFAGDAELPGLVEKTLANGWKRADIKKEIQNWRPDYFRV